MPRPGPRPYECVRRAWHSERHQPMRGSLIKEIFRVVSEIHSPATRKNKEWQEKLPIVVLKAEEIVYSKANSEAEYMDLNTLWHRANDAINTITRIDENAETGVLLQPCIEAALILGCTPRRTSRSQQNSDPRCYLSATAPEPTCVPPNNLEHIIQGNCITITPFMSHNSNFIMSLTAHKYPFLSGNFPPCLPVETYASSNPCSVYPLYYGSELQYQESQFSFRIPDSDNPNAAKTGHDQSPSPRDVSSTEIPRADLWDSPKNPSGIDCDLSLRLGPLSVPCVSIENSWPQELDDVDSSTSRENKMSSDLALGMDKEFSFFPKADADADADDSLEFYSSKLRPEAENMNVEETLRKRKAVFGNPSEDWELCFQPNLPCSPPDWKMSNTGS